MPLQVSVIYHLQASQYSAQDFLTSITIIIIITTIIIIIRFSAAVVDAPLLKNITIIDTPGVLSGEKQRTSRYHHYHHHHHHYHDHHYHHHHEEVMISLVSAVGSPKEQT
jgi:hypothetical protein